MIGQEIAWGTGISDETLRMWASSKRTRVEEHGVQHSLFEADVPMVKVIFGNQSALISKEKAMALGFQFGFDFGGR